MPRHVVQHLPPGEREVVQSEKKADSLQNERLETPKTLAELKGGKIIFKKKPPSFGVPNVMLIFPLAVNVQRAAFCHGHHIEVWPWFSSLAES